MPARLMGAETGKAGVISLAARGAIILETLILCAAPAHAQAPKPPDIRRRPNQDFERREQAAVRYVRSLPASVVGKGLPADKTFGAWLDDLLHVPLDWSLNDCGEGPYEDGPICVGFEDRSRELFVNIGVGTSKGGFSDDIVSGEPFIWFGEMNTLDRICGIDHLSDIPDCLKTDAERRRRFADHPLRSLSDDEAMRIVRDARASAIDAKLPDQAIGIWVTALLPPDIALRWTVGTAARQQTPPRPQIRIVTAAARWPNGSQADLSFDLELVQRGLASIPTFLHGEIYSRMMKTVKTRTQSYSSLSEFADSVREFSVQRHN